MIEQAQFGETSYFLLNAAKGGTPHRRPARPLRGEYAIDKQAQIDAVQAGLNTPANGLFSPGRRATSPTGNAPVRPR